MLCVCVGSCVGEGWGVSGSDVVLYMWFGVV